MILSGFTKKKNKVLLKEIESNHKLGRYVTFVFGILIMAVAFNLFLKPNNLISGVSGLSIITEKVFNIDPSLLILLANVLLLIASWTFLGLEKTKNTILGSLLYPVFIKLTDWVPNYVDFGNTETLVIALTGGVLSGIGGGLVFKNNFTSGGTDILKQIFSKYGKMPYSKANIYSEGPIVLLGAFIYGWQSFLYSIITIAIVGVVSDRVILGISEYKTLQIITSKEKDIKSFIIDNLAHGVTVVDAKGGFTGEHRNVLLCAIPTREYFLAIEGIKKIDPSAFVIVTDTYEIQGNK